MLLLIVYVRRKRKGATDVCGTCGKGMGEGFCNYLPARQRRENILNLLGERGEKEYRQGEGC